MPLPPLYSETLRGLRRQTEEDKRLTGIDYVVEDIYYAIIDIAKSSCKTSYELPLFEEQPPARLGRRLREPNTLTMAQALPITLINKTKSEFMIENIVDIIVAVQRVFPDSVVQQKILSRSDNGTYTTSCRAATTIFCQAFCKKPKIKGLFNAGLTQPPAAQRQPFFARLFVKSLKLKSDFSPDISIRLKWLLPISGLTAGTLGRRL